MSDWRIMFSVVYLLLVSKGIESCFRTSEHHYFNISTGISFYKECQCTEPGYTIRDLKWIDNHGSPIEPLGPGTEIYTDEQSDSISLYINNITKAMSGTYKCETRFNGVKYSQSYTIDAHERVYFYQTPSDQHLVYGQTSSIMCQPKSDANVYISWQKEKDGEMFDIYGDERYVIENDRLVIHNVTEDDAGRYKCTAQVLVTNEIADKFIDVEIVIMPVITGIKANPQNYSDSYDLVSTVVAAGSNLTIECIADGIPHPEYYWNRTFNIGGEVVFNDSERTLYQTAQKTGMISWRQEINTLVFDEVTPADEGIYRCHAYNLAGIATKDVLVEVLTLPKILNFANITDAEGATVQIICNATGTPKPSISIIYAGTLASYDDDIINVTDSDIKPNMEVMILDRSKEGFYFCEATNQVGSVNTGMYLTVLHQPYFKIQDERIWGWEGQTINLDCEQDSNPPAKMTWRYYSNSIEEENQINIQLLERLNSMNTNAEPFLKLTVDNETAYGFYECVAENKYGKATKRVILQKGFSPGAIEDVTIADLTATSITFNFTGPRHVEGPDVLGYTATYDEADNFNITDIHINRTWAVGRPYRLQKLKPKTTYYIRFAAQNEVGVGVWTEFYNFTTEEKSVPEPPVWDEEAIVLARNSHILKWRIPDDNGERIDFYTLKYCPLQGDDEESCRLQKIVQPPDVLVTELELVDLEFNTTYFLELAAHNVMGNSMASNITVLVPAPQYDSVTTLLPGGAIIGISIVIVVLCLLLLDVLLLVWRRKGIIATCCYKKDSKRKESALNTRDKKGLLNGESEDRPVARDNGHKEFQYNKNTGAVTGKHSAV